MHWHAIKQSTGLFSQANPGTPEAGLPLLDGNDSRVKAPTYTTDEESPFPTGDDACDLRPGNARWTDCNIPLLAATPHDVQKPDDAVRQLWSPGKQQHGTGGANAIDLVPISQAVASSSHGSALTEASLRSLESSFSHAGSDHDLIPLSSKATVENSQTGSDRSALPFLQVSIPMHPTNSLAPFAYQRALRNRIRDDELGPGRKYDIKAYTPIFVHDCLMVPGSLATICGKVRCPS